MSVAHVLWHAAYDDCLDRVNIFADEDVGLTGGFRSFHKTGRKGLHGEQSQTIQRLYIAHLSLGKPYSVFDVMRGLFNSKVTMEVWKLILKLEAVQY